MENESVGGIYWLITLEKAIYNVNNYIFYNYGPVPGDVLVQIDKKQNNTIASGYYSITGLTSHTNNPIINTTYNSWGQNLSIPGVRKASQ